MLLDDVATRHDGSVAVWIDPRRRRRPRRPNNVICAGRVRWLLPGRERT